MSYTRRRAVVCPSCGARRIVPGMIFCDQCGKRIPDSLMEKLKGRRPEPQERDQLNGPTGQTTQTPAPPRRDDNAGQSDSTRTFGDSMIKSDLGFVARGQETQQVKAEATPTTPLRRQQILGVVLVSFGIVTALISVLIGGGNLGGLGLASFLIGLLLIYLHSGPSFAPTLVVASVFSSFMNIERVLRDFGPDAQALYLKVEDRLDVPMVFLPLDENPAPPSGLQLNDRDRFLLIDPEDAHKTGLLLEAPGASLLSLMEEECSVDFIDMGREDFLGPLRSGMVESLELAADLKATVTQEGMNFKIKDGALGSLSQSIARSSPNAASRLGCPICSTAICAAVKAVKTNMILEEAVHQSGYHTVTLKFV